MSQVERTQCLLFVVHGETIQNLRKSRKVSYKSLVEGYALLPLSVRKKYPDVPALFKRNNIKVLTSGSKYRSLLTALKSGKCEIIEILLENDGKLYEIKTTRKKILHVTVDKSNKNLVKLLLKKEVKFFTELPRAEKTVVNPVTDPDNVKILKSLFVHGADIDVRCQEARVLLHLAALRNDETLAQLLLQHGADINSSRNNGATALHVAAEQGHVSFMKLLLKKKANVNAVTNYDCKFTNATPLHFAVHKKRCEAMKILLDHGADVNVVGFKECTVLQRAVLYNSLEMVKLILDYHPDLNSENNKSAFRNSIYIDSKDSTEMVNKMQNYGFTLDLQSNSEDSVLLHGAVYNNNFAMVEKLLKDGLDVSAPCSCWEDDRFDEGSPPIHTAATHGRDEMIKLLLKNGANINSVNNLTGEDLTPIIYAAKNGHLNTLKLLIESGGDIHLRDSDENTPLHFAAAKGSVETVQFLLLNNLDVNAKNDSEETAVFDAVAEGHLNVVEVLLKYGANINLKRESGESLLHVAVKVLDSSSCRNSESAERIVEFLLQNGANPNDVDDTGRTPLFTAVICNLKLVQILSNHGATIRLKDKSGGTALHIAAAAAKKTETATVKFLLESGIDVNVKSNDGRTPLFGAAKKGNEETIRILLEFGALVNVTDKNGSFILLESFINSHSKPFQYLLNYCFSDLEIFSSANIEKLCTTAKLASSGYFWWVASNESIKNLEKHLIKMKVAFPDLFLNFDQNWLSQNLINNAALERELTEEIARMKDDKIGYTDVSFFEVLTKNIKQLARLTKNMSCIELLCCNLKYPNYGDIVTECYFKGSTRHHLLEHCIKAFRFLFKNCPTLPYDIIEEILDHLNNQDLIILKNIFPTVK